jgi:hypothetical protein
LAASALTGRCHIDCAANVEKHAQYLAQDYLAQEYLAQKMHVVERIVAAMDVAGTSIILERQCRFATSDTLRLIITISRSHSVSTG